MKKYMGNYTSEAAKALKGSEHIICRVADDGTIYVTNGFTAYKMNPLEYAAVVQPVTCCEAGNWILDKNGKHDDDHTFDLVKCFSDAVKATDDSTSLTRCPLNLDTGKSGTAATFYNTDKGFVAFYNAQFISAFVPGFILRSSGTTSAAVAYIHGEPFAMVMPIKPDSKAVRAVVAYFTEATNNSSAQADKLRDELTHAQSEAADLRVQIEQQAAELDAMREAQQAAADHPQTSTTEPKTAAELIAARFADLPGVTVTIKGAHTSAPVVWLTGNTDQHTDEISAAGAKWSNKKSAFYVRVA